MSVDSRLIAANDPQPRLHAPVSITITFTRQLASVLALQSFIHQLKQLLLPEFDQRFAVDEETRSFVYTKRSPIFRVLLNVL